LLPGLLSGALVLLPIPFFPSFISGGTGRGGYFPCAHRLAGERVGVCRPRRLLFLAGPLRLWRRFGFDQALARPVACPWRAGLPGQRLPRRVGGPGSDFCRAVLFGRASPDPPPARPAGVRPGWGGGGRAPGE